MEGFKRCQSRKAFFWGYWTPLPYWRSVAQRENSENIFDQGPGCHTHGCICVEAITFHGFYQSLTVYGKDTRAGPFLGDMELLWQLTLSWRLFSGRAEPFLDCMLVWELPSNVSLCLCLSPPSLHWEIKLQVWRLSQNWKNRHTLRTVRTSKSRNNKKIGRRVHQIFIRNVWFRMDFLTCASWFSIVFVLSYVWGRTLSSFRCFGPLSVLIWCCLYMYF